MLNYDDVINFCVALLAFLSVTSAISAHKEQMAPVREARARLIEELKEHKTVKNRMGPSGPDQVVNITFSIWPFHVLFMDEISQSVTTASYTKLTWKDENLGWNASEYENISYFQPNFNIWRPTVLVINAADEDMVYMGHEAPVMLDFHGTLHIEAPSYLKTTCNLDLTYFPFDSQRCEIVFILLDLDSIEYRAVLGQMDELSNPVLIQGEWNITSRRLEIDKYLDAIPIIRCIFDIQRSPNFYVLNVLAPIVVTSAMTSLVFWIPPGSGEKMSFLVTVYVSNAVFLNLVASTMPRNLAKVPRLTLFMVFIIVESFFAMVATVIVMHRYQKEQEEEAREKEAAILDDDEVVTVCKNTGDNENVDGPKPHSQQTNSGNTVVKYLQQRMPKTTTVRPFDDETNSKPCNVKRSQKQKSFSCGRRVRATTLDSIFFIIFCASGVPVVYILFTF